VSSAERLHDPERVLSGTAQAIERARARGAESIEPDDLLAGMLLAVSRFGIVDLGPQAVDLADLGLRFDLPVREPVIKPRYTPAAVAVFDRAARLARGDDGARLAPIHFLVALADPAVPTFARIQLHIGIDAAAWRRLLAATVPPASRRGDAQGGARPTVSGGQDPLDALLTPEEAAQALGVHIQTVRGYIRAGKLAAFRVAGERAIRIRRDDLNALLEHLHVASTRSDFGPSPRNTRSAPGSAPLAT
jgi:excisionase family DNA binding protein